LTADAFRSAAMLSKAWPYEEARKLLKRWPDGKPGGTPVIFETGYGPSGLPHIGTFNEVLRTTFVRQAFQELSDAPTRLIAFSDDMDGLRKVPDNLPNSEMLRAHLGKPLTQIPDPFGTHESFAITTMRCFAASSTASASTTNSSRRPTATRPGSSTTSSARCFATGTRVMGVMLPTLREERRKTYSPVLPISPASGIVLQVPVEVVDAEAGIIAFEDEGQRIEQSALGGKAKLQWKVDWARAGWRWASITRWPARI
jgi:lysyl-tRNA synthetase, class I